MNLKDKIYKDRLRALHLMTLETRCIRGDLIETFKTMKGHANVDYGIFFSLSGGVRRGNSRKLVKTRYCTNLRKNIFSIMVMDLWNDLDQDVIDRINVDNFKKQTG